MGGQVKVVYRGYGKNYIEVHFVNKEGLKEGKRKIAQVEKQFHKQLEKQEKYDQISEQAKKQQKIVDDIVENFSKQEMKQLLKEFKTLAIEQPEDFLNICKSYPMVAYVLASQLQGQK